ncbi:MAG: HflK protein, membrane protease subunit HflK [Candidatus Dadabacteria bacterium CSP1-2]|nr:MAG: HflK protein, membrane protease subunit HflK [Candidatus Dadabacteria bacterium CSP1-2]
MSVFRRIREFKKPTNGSGQGGVRRFPRVIFIYIVLGAWILLSSFYIVDADEQGVVKRFGKYNRTQKPGVHFKAPWPIESVLKPRVTEVKRIEIGFRTIDPGPPASYRHIPEESLMLTGDLNIVSSEFIVQYRIKNAEEYLFNVKDVDTTIRDAAEAAKRQVVGDKEVDYVLTVGKAEIQEEVRSLLQEIMDSYGAGIHIVAVQLQDVEPPKPVIGAFKDVASAKEDRDKFINQAEAYWNEIIPTAQGEAKKLWNEAEAYKAEKVNRAKGEADRFTKILDETKKNEGVTRKRLYLETMESVLSGMDKFIIDSKNSSSLNFLELRGKTSDEIKKELGE